MLQQPGQEPKQLNNQEVVQIMTQQLNDLKKITEEKQQLENIVKNLQDQLMKKTKEVKVSKDLVNKLQREIKEKEETPKMPDGYNGPKQGFTRIPIEIVEDEPAKPMNKSEPEVKIIIQGD